MRNPPLPAHLRSPLDRALMQASTTINWLQCQLEIARHEQVKAHTSHEQLTQLCHELERRVHTLEKLLEVVGPGLAGK